MADSTTTSASLLDAIKGQLWSHFIDNPLLQYHALFPPITSSSIVNSYGPASPQTAMTLIVTLFENFITNEFSDCEHARGLYICSKYAPINHLITRLFTNMNTSNGIYETRRGLHYILALILFRRRSSTRCLLEHVLPYLINMKSNEFMLEPNVYTACLILSVLLLLELNTNQEQIDDLFRVKSWQPMETMFQETMDTNVHDITPKYSDTSVTDAYHWFLDWSSKELFSGDNVRPVNYFHGWLQTILWMFSRTAKSLKPFIKPKLVSTSFSSRSLLFETFPLRLLNYPNIYHCNFLLKKFLVY